jgi:hypothetical protein
MLELAEHILDIAENSIRAGAGTVEIIINEDSAKDLLTIEIKMAGGSLRLKSAKGKGTKLTATFALSHLDRQPMGNITTTMLTLIAGNSGVDFIYKHRHSDRRFTLDTRQIRKEIEDVPINHPEIIKYIRGVIDEGLREIKPTA